MAELYPPETTGITHPLMTRQQLRLTPQLLFYLVLFQLRSTFQFHPGLIGKTLLIGTVYRIADIEEVLHHQQRILGQEREKRYFLLRHRRQLRHDLYPVATFLRQLILHLEGTDGVDVIAEEVNAERIFATVGIDVEDGAAQGKLTRFVDIVHLAETELAQCFLNRRHGDGLVFLQDEGTRIEILFRHHQLCQCFRISHNIAERGLLCKPRKNFGAENLIGGIALGILDGPTITAGEEQHIPVAQQLRQVVIEIARLLGILKDKKH